MPIFNNRQSSIEGRTLSRHSNHVKPRRHKRALGRLLVVLLFLIGGWLFFKEQLQPPLERFIEETLIPWIEGDAYMTGTKEFSVEHYLPQPDEKGASLGNGSVGTPISPDLPVETVNVSVGTFHAVDSAVHTISRELPLSQSATYLVDAFPADLDGDIYFGSVYFNRLGVIGVLFVKGKQLARLYVDLNQNADFSDDGAALVSPSSAFEVTLRLPMEKVSGIAGLESDYRVWVYQPPGKEFFLRYYPLTQLQGEIMLDGEEYSAVIAENLSIDGDFTNEGVYVDQNRDDFISAGDEYIRPGNRLVVGEHNYEFRLNP